MTQELNNFFPICLCDIILEYAKCGVLIVTDQKIIFLYDKKFIYCDLPLPGFKPLTTNRIKMIKNGSIYTLTDNKIIGDNIIHPDIGAYEYTIVGSPDGLIYYLGGKKWDETTDSAYVINGRTVTKIAPMNFPRHKFNAIYGNGCIYVVGGENSVEFYDPRDNKWTKIEGCPYICYQNKIAFLNDELYIFNFNNKGYLISLMIYNTLIKKWTSRYNLMDGRCNFEVCVYENRIHFIGGTENSKNCRRIDYYEDGYIIKGFPAPDIGECSVGEW